MPGQQSSKSKKEERSDEKSASKSKKSKSKSSSSSGSNAQMSKRHQSTDERLQEYPQDSVRPKPNQKDYPDEPVGPQPDQDPYPPWPPSESNAKASYSSGYAMPSSYSTSANIATPHGSTYGSVTNQPGYYPSAYEGEDAAGRKSAVVNIVDSAQQQDSYGQTFSSYGTPGYGDANNTSYTRRE